ncbi:hypothetical protein BY458DRAFT_520675 [Sporodiniella umbellata]|nr:hypothetical protein BY458DRAFT_520675 [Sporodiniella umbellata]
MSEWGDTSENFWSTSPSASSRTITYDKEESLKDEDNCFLILSSDEEKISNQKGRCISRSNRTKEKAKKTPSTDRTNKDLNDSKKRKLTPQQIANIAEYDDYDLDDAVEKLLRPTKRQTLETVRLFF